MSLKEPIASLKERCAGFLKFANLVKGAVVLACVVVMVQQVVACVNKLINKPISTYTHFEFNTTLLYPSVTLCRQPSYKYSELQKYNLYSHPKYTSVWRTFDFNNHSLDEVWSQTTFSPEETFVQYGLDGSINNVDILTTLTFVYGRCFTISPNVRSSRASQSSGYSITLQHAAEDINTNTELLPPGYHVFIHYVREPFTEVQADNGGLVEYLYVNTGEAVNVKLAVNQYVQISEPGRPCSDQEEYNANECTAKQVWELVEEQVGCSGPWMRSRLPRCASYSRMRSLISTYMSFYMSHNFTSCPRICRAYLYNAFVTNRQQNYLWDTNNNRWTVRSGDASLQTQLFIHFNSMMVSVYEERHNYDWNLFLSDLGGSVGFLLGLSVIGIMAIVGKIWSTFVLPFISSKSWKDAASVTTDVTTDIKDKEKYYIDKCDDWDQRNAKLGSI